MTSTRTRCSKTLRLHDGRLNATNPSPFIFRSFKDVVLGDVRPAFIFHGQPEKGQTLSGPLLRALTRIYVLTLSLTFILFLLFLYEW